MTKHFMTSAERTKIIEVLKENPNAAAAARQFGFGETTINRLCKEEGIELQHLLTKAEKAEVVELLKTNQNALATAKQLGINHKTVLAVAKKERIDIKAMRQAAVGRKTPRFMQWARGPGGKPVLLCVVYRAGSSARKGIRDYFRFCPSLRTSDPEVAAQRMRLILWHAIAEGQLRENHPAWVLYRGPIPLSTKRLLTWLAGLPWAQYEPHRKEVADRLGYTAKTIDWLTKHDMARQADPVRGARARTLARSRARKTGKLLPISKSWQFGPVGTMLAVHPNEHPIYGKVTIAGVTLSWPLAVQNRADAEALVQPAVAVRTRLRDVARAWRECRIGSPEAKAALSALLREQRRFRDALKALGANRSKGWAEVVEALKQPPPDGTSWQEACTRWFVELLIKNPERPPPGRPVEILLMEANDLFGVGGRTARRCYMLAQEITSNRKWSGTRRPQKRKSRISSHLAAAKSLAVAAPR
jgi:hypothetical protein